MARSLRWGITASTPRLASQRRTRGWLSPLSPAALLGQRSRRGGLTSCIRRLNCVEGDLPGRQRPGAVSIPIHISSGPARGLPARPGALFDAPAAERAARTLVPSIHHMSQSILPCLSGRMRSALATQSDVPSLRQRLKRS